MVRPKSAITGQKPRQLISGYSSGVNVRWTEQHHITFLRLGGSKWLRAQIEKEMQCEQQAQKPECATTSQQDKR